MQWETQKQPEWFKTAQLPAVETINSTILHHTRSDDYFTHLHWTNDPSTKVAELITFEAEKQLIFRVKQQKIQYARTPTAPES